MAETTNVELADMIQNLRQELIKAQDQGADEDLRFIVEDIELELTVSVQKKEGIKSGIKFFVITGAANADDTNTSMQKIKLKLRPEEISSLATTDGKKNKPVKISGVSECHPD